VYLWNVVADSLLNNKIVKQYVATKIVEIKELDVF